MTGAGVAGEGVAPVAENDGGRREGRREEGRWDISEGNEVRRHREDEAEIRKEYSIRR